MDDGGSFLCTDDDESDGDGEVKRKESNDDGERDACDDADGDTDGGGGGGWTTRRGWTRGRFERGVVVSFDGFDDERWTVPTTPGESHRTWTKVFAG